MHVFYQSLGLTGEDSPVKDYNWKMAMALTGIYFVFVSERLLKLCLKEDRVSKYTSILLMFFFKQERVSQLLLEESDMRCLTYFPLSFGYLTSCLHL